MLGYAAVMLLPRYRMLPASAQAGVSAAISCGGSGRFAAPGGMQWLVECGSFTLFITLVGGLGKLPQAATMLAFNVNSVAWVPMMGMGLAVSTLVGQQLGGNRPGHGRPRRLDGLRPGHDLHVYDGVVVPARAGPLSHGPRGGHGPGTVRPAAGLDRSAAPLRGGLLPLRRHQRSLHVSAIRGAGDTRFVFWTSLGTSLFPLGMAWVGIHRWGFGLLWCWTLITVWVLSAGFIYLGRFLQGKWRSMRVIEPEMVEVA